ncbi:hypothetical protein [Dysgonomonas sp. 511]|uniref:hypothetical protein n=1 Tax=Dysgonomonas sp. 511 TaxID=2302930 RepID=UPI0013D61CB8|nr:hypothetical protein [Dysgonomonas sp. 511]NDV78696.1 hypothetical protein [Dysgonomonas sp. 511]
MKNLKLLSFLFVAVLSFGFVSCSDDDDDDNGVKNVLNYDSKSYEISGGHILDYGYGVYNESLYNLDLYLYTKGMNIDEETGDLSGEGKVVYAELWSSTAELTAGTYTSNPWGNEVKMKANTFSSLTIWDGDTEVQFTEGTVTIGKSGDNYTITIAGTGDDGKALSASYRGTLKSFIPKM